MLPRLFNNVLLGVLCFKRASVLPPPIACPPQHTFGDVVPIHQGVDETSRVGDADLGDGFQFGRCRRGFLEIVDHVLGHVASSRFVDGWVEEGHQRRAGHVLCELVQVVLVEADAAAVFPQVKLEPVEGLRPYRYGQGGKVVVELLRHPENSFRLLAAGSKAVGDAVAITAPKVSRGGLHKDALNQR